MMIENKKPYKSTIFLLLSGGKIVAKISESVDKTDKASDDVTNIIFWTPQQQSILNNRHKLKYVVLDSFYSTGKTILLKFHASKMLQKGETVKYFCDRRFKFEIPFEMRLKHEFSNFPNFHFHTPIEYRSSSYGGYYFHQENVVKFCKKFNLKKDDHLCFDETVLDSYPEFLAFYRDVSLHVKTLWVAVGYKKYIEANQSGKSWGIKGILLPDMDVPLRNPKDIAEFAGELNENELKMSKKMSSKDNNGHDRQETYYFSDHMR